MTDQIFTEADRRHLSEREISTAEAMRQLVQLRRGQAFQPLQRPCVTGDGITRLDPAVRRELIDLFGRSAEAFTRFVPASGAASRMFKGLFPGETDPDKMNELKQHLERFPFYPELETLSGKTPESLDNESLAQLLLTAEGLDLAGKPKGLLPLHRGMNYNRTAFAEHIHESVTLGIRRFHFTVSPDHMVLFKQELETMRSALGPVADELEVTFSIQSPRTDTLALDPTTGEPFRTEAGLLFRPAGHGALLGNLENAGADMALLRNIDNVVPESRQGPYREWTAVLGGMLLQTRQQVFDWLDRLDRPGESSTLEQADDFLRRTFGRQPEGHRDDSDRTQALRELLDRPIRICGMVPAGGQPGGGPFWTRDALGQVTPQIVEGAQIESDDPEQQTILAASTHFNPVNIACSLQDRSGRPYRLEEYVDPEAVIITAKSTGGRELLALERPGLWNGGMSGWNTVFIEMPPETFNPVKTVFDLLQPAHQPG